MIYICVNNSPKRAGGVERVVRKILENISVELHPELMLLCNDDNEGEKFVFNGIDCKNIKSQKGNLILNSFFLYSRLAYSYKIYTFLKHNIRDGDIINFHGLEYLFFTSLFRKQITKKVKIILTVHGSFFQFYSNLSSSFFPRYLLASLFFFFERWYIFFIEKISNKRVDYYIFLTKRTFRFYKKYFKIIKPYSLIPNGIDINKRVFSRKIFKRKFRFVTIGSNVKTKGLDIAIRAIEKVNKINSSVEAELIVVGFPDFHKYYKKNILSSHLCYAGTVKPEHIDEWYEKAHCLLLPSRSEEFPIVVLEALQNGLPFIVSNNCNTDEIPGHGGFGYIVDGYCEDDWVEAIQKMKIRENYSKFVNNIDSHNFSSFDWKNIARKYEEVYELMQVKT